MKGIRLSDTNKACQLENGNTLIQWLRECQFFKEKRVHIVESGTLDCIIRLYTDRTRYQIKVTNCYLGCTASSRKPRPGEDWTRGNDLPDGPFSKDTFYAILGAIVCYELKEVVKPRPPGGVNDGNKTVW